MNSWLTALQRLSGPFALISVLAALGAGPALADPPNHPRIASVQVGLAHEPEIVSGIASPTPAARPAPRPEIISGIESADVRDHQLIGQLSQADASTSQPGFAWNDAGIGAGVTFAAVLLAAGSVFAVRRRASLAH